MSSIKIDHKKYKVIRRLSPVESSELEIGWGVIAKLVSTSTGPRAAVQKDGKWEFHVCKPLLSVQL